MTINNSEKLHIVEERKSIMKKLYVFCVLLITALVACDLNTNPQSNEETNTPIVTGSDQDSSKLLFVAIWTDGDTSFYLNSPEYNRTIQDTLIHIRAQKMIGS